MVYMNLHTNKKKCFFGLFLTDLIICDTINSGCKITNPHFKEKKIFKNIFFLNFEKIKNKFNQF